MPIIRQDYHLCFRLTGYKSHDPHFGFDNLLEQLTKLRVAVYLLDYGSR